MNDLHGPPNLQLLLVCRQIYAEAALIPFKQGCFYFFSHNTAEMWVTTVLEAQRNAITEVEVFAFDVVDTPLHYFPGLKKLYLRSFTEPTTALREYWMKDLRKLTGIEDLDVELIDVHPGRIEAAIL